MSELDAGTVVDGSYEILAAIGSGGLGTVYRARDVDDDSTVALKMLNITGDEAQQRFLREFNILSRIRHPRIVRSHKWGLNAGKPYFSMDYIHGRPLSDLIASAEDRENLGTFWFNRFLLQIAEGLSYIHNHGLVHRDLKPSNIIISQDYDEPSVMILDLGLARFQDSRVLRLTQLGSTTGTAECMSPEQIRGRAVDQRSDLYSLGVILYEILTGRPPFVGENAASVMFQHLRDLPNPPRAYVAEISSNIQVLVMKLLEKEPIDRYDSVRTLLQDMPDDGDGSVDWENGPDLTTTPPTPFFNPQFVGREREMKVLREVLAQSGDGMGRMVLVSGQVGIGKSQVLEEFQADARVHGMRILTGRCHESGGRAYGPFLYALQELAKKPRIEETDVGKAVERVLVELEQPVTAMQKNAFPAMEILSEFLVHLSREKPTLVCIEDLQWADDMSLRFLHFMMRNPDPTALIFGLTCRNEDEDPLPARLEAITKGAVAPGIVHLQLERLSFEDTTNLAASLVGEQAFPVEVAQRIYEQTGGNPLFVVELVRSSIEGGAIRQDSSGRWTWRNSHEWPMPSGVVRGIEFRLRRLRAAQRQVLEYASIFRRAFTFEIISQVWRGDNLELLEALEGLVRLGLLSALEDSEGRYRFTHGLLQRAVYVGISEKKRSLLHLEAGKALEPRLETDRVEVLDDLAYHFSNSDDLVKMTRYLTASGRWSLWMQDFSRGLQQFEAVLEKGAFSSNAHAGVSEGSTTHLDFLCAYAEALSGCGRFEEARTTLEKAMQRVSAETPVQKAHALRMLGINYSYSGDFQKAESVLLEGLELYRDLGDAENELMVLGLLSNLYLKLSDKDSAVKYCQFAAEKCRKLGGKLYEARALINLAFAADITYQTDRAKEFLESSIDLLEKAGDRVHRYSCLYLLARIEIRIGNFDRSEEIFLELKEFWGRCGSKRAEADACHYLGRIALERNDAESAIAHSHCARKLLSHEGSVNESYGACALVAEASVEAGRIDDALEWSERSWPGIEAGGPIRAAVLTARAKSLSAAGRHDDVRSLFEKELHIQRLPEGLEQVQLFLAAGNYYTERGHSDDARCFLQAAKAASEEMGFRYYAGKASQLLSTLPGEGQQTSIVAELALALSGNHLATLYEVSEDLTSILDLNELLDRTTERLMKVSGADRAMIALLDEDRSGIQVERAYRLDDSATREISHGIVKSTMDRNEVIFTLDARADERFKAQKSVIEYGIRSVLCVPLRHAESGVIGALYMDNRNFENLSCDNDRAFMVAFANLVSVAVVNARMYNQIEERARFLQRQFEHRYRLGALVGRSQSMQEVFDLLKRAGESDVTVLIQGETGTGKELAARAIHSHSKRKEQPFLSANCAALASDLLQSELFGHRKGAFTGAVSDRKGLFESADGGTVLLDEIGDASPQLQSSLLRVLQEGEFQRLGETVVRNVDVRVIAATNRDLEADVRNGSFREDLYFRLRVLQVEMPPLRSHIEDVPVLCEHILKRVCADQNKAVPGFTLRAMRALMDHSWSGNVRELENEISRAVVLVEEGKEISVDLFSEKIGLSQGSGASERGYFKARVSALEKRMIVEALDECNGNITSTAHILGLSRNGLQKMMTRYGLR
ncbi:MAG: sigma 54-interacting transcriptional regulator [Gemmatimonadetes bacterium]|nr:sigma 54-interacting transcriptional regulator [Gemmatimonadota bacterium]